MTDNERLEHVERCIGLQVSPVHLIGYDRTVCGLEINPADLEALRASSEHELKRNGITCLRCLQRLKAYVEQRMK